MQHKKLVTSKHRRDYIREGVYRKIVASSIRRHKKKEQEDEETPEKAYDRAMRGI